jgi:peptidoglycan/xylan/chitin deacetylase (PgdA/CDA1 family)
MRNQQPLISFTFDDFPRSALFTGGSVLEKYGAVGTYYTSLGLMGRTAPTGEMFRQEDLEPLLQRGHELGCHTFSHCHAYDTPAPEFERSILENRRTLRALVPEADFRTLSYPISGPRPNTKRRTAKYFAACRGGGQVYNSGTIDLNNLQAFFLEQSRDNPQAIKELVDSNRRAGGWLVFATHDVCDNPTRFGCHPAFFDEVVRYSLNSGAAIVSVSKALEHIGLKPRKPSNNAPCANRKADHDISAFLRRSDQPC